MARISGQFSQKNLEKWRNKIFSGTLFILYPIKSCYCRVQKRRFPCFLDALEIIFKNYIKILFGRCVESGLVKVNDNEVDVDYRQGAGTTLN